MARSGKERAERATRIVARAAEIIARGDHRSARPLLVQAARLGPLPAADWLALVDGLLRCGEALLARQLLEGPAPDGRDPADRAHRSGRLLMVTGDPMGALAELERACVLRPDHPDALRDLASCAVGLGDVPRACLAFAAVTGLPGATAIDWANLARALIGARPADAMAAADRAVALAGPGEAYPFVVRALCHLEAGSGEAAAAAVGEALQRAPGDPVALGLAASVAYQQGRHADALAGYGLLAQRLPQDPLHCANAAGACLELERWQEARAFYAQAHARGGGVQHALNACLALPAIPASSEEIAALRAGVARGLEALARSGERIAPETHPGVMVMPFYLAYHGECNRALHEQWAHTSLQLAPWLGYTARHCDAWRGPRGRRIRVGLVSAFFHDHSIGRTTRGFVERLDRTRFHVTTIFIGQQRHDELAGLMRDGADAWLEVPLQPGPAREAIAELELDVLFYQDIGMEPLSRWLAHARLAPVQCYSFGHPDTTGLPTIDWFVSSALFEPPGAEAHYSERLWCIPEVGTLAWYRQPAPAAPLPRAGLGVPEQAHFHLCAQALFKLHPGFDALIEEILVADPQAHVGLVHGTREAFAPRLTERFARRPGLDLARVHVLPRVSSSDFHRLLAAADVVLDTTHFNGMNTSLEAFAQGKPVITLPGSLQRGRHTAAMYARLGHDDGLARDAADYVARAVDLAADAGRRRDFAARVSAAAPRLFHDDAVIRGFEQFFEHAVQAAIDQR